MKSRTHCDCEEKRAMADGLPTREGKRTPRTAARMAKRTGENLMLRGQVEGEVQVQSLSVVGVGSWFAGFGPEVEDVSFFSGILFDVNGWMEL